MGLTVELKIVRSSVQPSAHKMSLTKRGLLVLAASAATLGALGGVALGSIPDSGTKVFHGCVSIKSGALRLIDPSKGQSCSGPESPVSWDQTGQPGAAGRNGSRILSGAQAPTGGDVGDYYLDTTNETLYGPKVLHCQSLGHCLAYWPSQGITLGGTATHVWACPAYPATSACTSTNGVGLYHFTNTLIAELKLPAGSYYVSTKVQLYNTDTATQPMTCALNASYNSGSLQGGAIDLDSDVAFPGSTPSSGLSGAGSAHQSSEFWSLEGTVSYTRTGYMSLVCNTFKGAADGARLFAVQVGGIN